MKKRLLGIFLCVAMTVTLIAGCSGESNSSSSDTSSSDTSSDAAEEDTSSDSNEGGTATSEGGAFDEFTRPTISEDGVLTVANLHTKPEVESQNRSIMQCELECEQRGWEYVDVVWESDTEWADLFQNLINQGH